MATRRKSLRHKGLRRGRGHDCVVSPYISKVYNRGFFCFPFVIAESCEKSPVVQKK